MIRDMMVFTISTKKHHVKKCWIDDAYLLTWLCAKNRNINHLTSSCLWSKLDRVTDMVTKLFFTKKKMNVKKNLAHSNFS